MNPLGADGLPSKRYIEGVSEGNRIPLQSIREADHPATSNIDRW